MLKFQYCLLLLSLVFSADRASSGPITPTRNTIELSHQAAVIGPCPLFPAGNIWNTPIDHLPVDWHSADYIRSMTSTTNALHPDFGSGFWDGAPIGIPYNLVAANQPGVNVQFEYAGESDPGPYPIPANPFIEGRSDQDGDHHLLIVAEDTCTLYELFHAEYAHGEWLAGSGAIFNLTTNSLRPQGWTSADAAGLPILAGLARYEEIASGGIHHALRFTASLTQKAYVWPARHYASSATDPTLPPMGQRFRLKASFTIPESFSPQTKAILQALKTYGMILADNGSNWYISGSPDERWNNEALVSELRQVRGTDFEAVDVSSLIIDPDSAQAKTAPPGNYRLYLPSTFFQ